MDPEVTTNSEPNNCPPVEASSNTTGESNHSTNSNSNMNNSGSVRLRAFEIEPVTTTGSSFTGSSTATTGALTSSTSSTGTGKQGDGEGSNLDPMVDPHAADLGGDIKAAVIGIIKAMVGPAILYLPHGFVAAGYLVALPIMAISTVMYLHSSKCLLETWKWESEKQLVPQIDITDQDQHSQLDDMHTAPANQRPNSLSYSDLAYRAFGAKGETLVKVGIALMQSGVCLTYLIFVPHNLHSSLLNILGWSLPPNFFLFLMLCIQIPLSWIRDIRKFTTTNALANACILYGLIVCLCFAFAQATAPYNPDQNNDPTPSSNNQTVVAITDDVDATPAVDDHGPIGNLWQHFTHLNPLGDHWILFIGTSVLLFEGSITLLIPLQEAVQPPSPQDPNNTDRERFPFVYPQVILGIQIFYVVFAVSCWMSFGDQIDTVLTTSLPPGFIATTVQLAYSVAVLFTFPLQNYPALEIACHSIAQTLQQNVTNTTIPPILLQRNTIAAILVCLLGIVAVTTMDSLDKVVSLTGALIGIPIAFIIPPLIHSQLVPNLPEERIKQNKAVAALGSVAMVVASFTTIVQWND